MAFMMPNLIVIDGEDTPLKRRLIKNAVRLLRLLNCEVRMYNNGDVVNFLGIDPPPKDLIGLANKMPEQNYKIMIDAYKFLGYPESLLKGRAFKQNFMKRKNNFLIVNRDVSSGPLYYAQEVIGIQMEDGLTSGASTMMLKYSRLFTPLYIDLAIGYLGDRMVAEKPMLRLFDMLFALFKDLKEEIYDIDDTLSTLVGLMTHSCKNSKGKEFIYSLRML